LRIIAGTARGKKLAVFSGVDIRPTPDRVREAVFNILFSSWGEMRESRILDLFAGTGAMGIEALSRGARHAVLVDRSEQALKLISRNLRSCNFETRARLIRSEIGKAVSMLGGKEQFDIIFLDPPYGHDLVRSTITEISRADLLAPSGIICAESGRKDAVPCLIEEFSRIEERRYGATAVHFLTRSEGKALLS